MKRSRLILGSALIAAALAPVVAAAAAAIATAVAGPEVSGSQALGATADLVRALSARNWAAALGPALLLVGFILKSDRLGPLAIFSRIPPRYRALAMLIGGGATAAGISIGAGMSPGTALLSGFQAAASATGLYEVWQGASGATNSGDVRAAVRAAMALPDAAARDEALAKIGTNT